MANPRMTFLFLNPWSSQDACTEADGARIAGRRIRVTQALPRNKGPRNRFVADRYRGGEQILNSLIV